MDLRADLLDLSRRLREEQLFISSERNHLQSLNERVQQSLSHLYHVAWIARQQRWTLESLVLPRQDVSPSVCCQRANHVERANFIDAYKTLGFHESVYSGFLQALRSEPSLLAWCLAIGEKRSAAADIMPQLAHITMDSIYGHCLLREDEVSSMKLLRHLMELQLATSDNPRRQLRHGSCAFSQVYKIFTEGLFPAKLFLTAALHEPIMQLLMEDELFLDIDPSKAAVRFPPHERLRRFGEEGSPQYAANLQKYRTWIINKLVNLTNRFIVGIKTNMYCFPASLLWLVKQLYNVVMKARRVEVREVGAMCADLVFAFFICPAIVNPEPYGICDAPISYIARFNLMQVAQILQVLAMSKWEEIDPKLMDLYSRFDKDCMSSLLDMLLEGGVEDSPGDVGIQLPALTRTAMLITEPDLQTLLRFLRQVATEVTDDCNRDVFFDGPQHPLRFGATNGDVSNDDGTKPNQLDEVEAEVVSHRQKLLNLLSAFPAILTPQIQVSQPESIPSSLQTPPQTPSTRQRILNRVSSRRSKLGTRSLHHPPSPDRGDDSVSLGLGNGNGTGTGDEPHRLSPINVANSNITSGGAPIPDVLVVNLNIVPECPGLLSESRVLSLDEQSNGSRGTGGDEESVTSAGGELTEKRTRFSLSHDQDSIGNTSDNLEAASNHSVTSSLELENENENENDNLSDMVSANVSGRGTPNVSGRDTPSSQLEGDERRTLDVPVTAHKQNREDISDKFGKFEIKQMMEGDETVSLVSDTWSTDVLASDSETVEQPLPPPTLEDVGRNYPGIDGQPSLLDILETASEAWSTDVLASDSERPEPDGDTDETGSVARSDDTAGSVARLSDISGTVGVRSDDTRRDSDASSEGLAPPECSSDAPLAPALPAGVANRLDLMSSGEHADENLTPRASGMHSPIDGVSSMLDTLSGTDWLSSLQAAVGFRPIKTRLPEGDESDDLSAGGEWRNMRGANSDAMSDAVPPPKSSQGTNSSTGISALIEGVEEEEGRFSAPDDAQLAGVVGMQTLGSLSISVSELADNGIVSSDIPLPHHRGRLSDSDRHHPKLTARPRRTAPNRNSAPSDSDRDGRCLSLRNDEFPSRSRGNGRQRLMSSPVKCSSSQGLGNVPPTDIEVNGGSPKILPQASSTPREPLPDDTGDICIVVVDENGCPPATDILGEFDPFHPGDSKEDDDVIEESANMVLPLPKVVCDLKTPSPEFGGAGICVSTASLSSNSSSSSGAGSVSAASRSGSTSSSGAQVNVTTATVPARTSRLPSTPSSPSASGPSESAPASTGAIPKSISFDKTAERGDKEHAANFDDHKKRGFFKSFKLPFKSGRGSRKSMRSAEEVAVCLRNEDRESGDDILAKYRRKTAAPDVEAANTPDVTNDTAGVTTAEEERVYSFESGYAFADAKRKLRLVLNNADLQNLLGTERVPIQRAEAGDTELLAILRTLLAEAINLKDRTLVAQLHELIRVIGQFDRAGCKKLFRALRDDYRRRYPYVAYLVRCRQGLLATLAHIDRVIQHVERDKLVCHRFMMAVCTRLFLEKKERALQRFIEEFQKRTAADEKTDLVENFLQSMFSEITADPIWQGASEGQLELAKEAAEQSIMSQIYLHALYPNGDGDVLRDQVLQEHIQKLSKIISPNHRDLRIPKMYHYECPWPSAQAEIKAINAYKTPRAKLQCVLRCCTTIVHLLGLASERSVPAADDLIPVLVYVIVAANPPALLSTIQYVTSFLHRSLGGEEDYWWTQFCSAVQFIKTMDYTTE